jgi:hypothetical protein
MAALDLVERLEYVRPVGKDRWFARCPAHEDRDPSLSITEHPDGRVLINCFAGCGALDVITAVGLEWSALFPPVDTRYKPIRSRPKDEEHERIVIAICEADRAAGKRLTKAEKARELEAFKRVHGGKR